MRSLSNRLRLSWLTIVGLLTFMIVASLTPDGIAIARLTFAGGVDEFKAALLRRGESALAIQTINMVRAQLAADMMFLVAYALLLRKSVQVLRSVPLAAWVARGAILLMAADVAENILTLSILRPLGDANDGTPSWWFTGMNVAAALKWALAGGVLLCLSAGWRREISVQTGWRRWAGLAISVAFGLGGVASLAVIAGLAIDELPEWIAIVALIAPAVALIVQFRLLDTSPLMVRFLYLARVPCLVLVIMAAFGPIALGPAVNLLGGILVAANVIGVAFTTAAAVVVVFACGTQINIIRAYAWQRVQDDTMRVLDHEVLASAVFWTGVVAAASLMFSVAVASPAEVWKIAAGIVLGTSGALVLLFVIEWLAARLSYNPPGYPLSELAVPFRRVPLLGQWLNDAAYADAPHWKRHFIGAFVSRLFGLSSGYVELLPDGRRRILPGHSFAAIQFLLTTLLFWAVLYAKSRPPGQEFFTTNAARTDTLFLVPTVTSVVLLLLLTGWALAAVAFFFDRYRTPLFTAAIAVAFITGAQSYTDYKVTVEGGRGSYVLATPGEVLRAFGSQPLVVAAAGGGIQAGAWTARVLEGVDEHLNGEMRRRVAAVSAVSGGSMGALYYGAYIDRKTLRPATEQALKPSLDDVATALVGRDVFGVIGLRFGRDRGAALESSWEARLPEATRGETTLRKWSEKTRTFASSPAAPAFPAFIFNSTIVESGQPVAFATTQLPTRRYRARFDAEARQHPTVENANRIFRLSTGDDVPPRDVGLKAVTAARLSAAFPYVSPAASLDLKDVEPFHLVDGGYYDVYGLVALSQWLDDALEEIAATGTTPTTVGVIVARGLASSDSVLLTRLRNDDPTTPSLDRTIEPRGWRWQLTAPPSTALNSRTYAQWAGGVQVLKMLTDKWSPRKVQIVPYVFDYPGSHHTPVCQSAPLSWKLTRAQQECIDRAWKTFISDRSSALYRIK